MIIVFVSGLSLVNECRKFHLMGHKGRKFSFIESFFFILCATHRVENPIPALLNFHLMCKPTLLYTT